MTQKWSFLIYSPMLARQRQRMILSMLETQPSLRTIELARKFDVTDETIRRDLELLDSENKLIRTHGGALRIEKRIHDIPMLSRLKENRDQKREIARKALEYIKEGETTLGKGIPAGGGRSSNVSGNRSRQQPHLREE